MIDGDGSRSEDSYEILVSRAQGPIEGDREGKGVLDSGERLLTVEIVVEVTSVGCNDGISATELVNGILELMLDGKLELGSEEKSTEEGVGKSLDDSSLDGSGRLDNVEADNRAAAGAGTSLGDRAEILDRGDISLDTLSTSEIGDRLGVVSSERTSERTSGGTSERTSEGTSE